LRSTVSTVQFSAFSRRTSALPTIPLWPATQTRLPSREYGFGCASLGVALIGVVVTIWLPLNHPSPRLGVGSPTLGCLVNRGFDVVSAICRLLLRLRWTIHTWTFESLILIPTQGGESYEMFDFRLRCSHRLHGSGRGDSRSTRSHGASVVRGFACTRRR
jgi:hypothetical protein